MLQFERKLLENGLNLICGIDEAGRGPLAGPVVVAGVILPLNNTIDGINDSKQLSEKKRQALFEKIMEQAIDVQIAVVDNQIIDQINILNATKRGMLECLNGFRQVEHALIDAVKINCDVPTTSIVHGDQLSYLIAAASIVAKVSRDKLMREFHQEFPEYCFDKHKGYGTALHFEKLRQFGRCRIHRNSFLKGQFV